MKKLLIIPVIILLLVGCDKTSYKVISVNRAHEMMNDAIVIDVRSYGEYSGGHLKGAINIPYDKIDTIINSKVKDKTKNIILYCQSGVRAKTAAEILVSMDYTNIYTFGGIKDWTYDIVK